MALVLALAPGTSELVGRRFLGGAAVGAAGTGSAHGYQSKQALERLEEQHERGQISPEEYLRRKREIERGSIVY
jgi:uncharacterized membrane protein